MHGPSNASGLLSCVHHTYQAADMRRANQINMTCRTKKANERLLLQDHHSFPSIVQYYAFNEGWGQYDTQRIVQMGHVLDPTRLWGPTSGWVDPQDATASQGSDYEHYTGYVRSTLAKIPTCISSARTVSSDLLCRVA